MRQTPVHDVMYSTYLNRYCDYAPEACALYQVMDEVGFLEVPEDLLPNQTFRVQKTLDTIREPRTVPPRRM